MKNPSLKQAAIFSCLCESALFELFPDFSLLSTDFYPEGVSLKIQAHQNFDKVALEKLEDKIFTYIRQDLTISTHDMMRENAVDYFLHHNLPAYAEKAALIETNIVSFAKFQDRVFFQNVPEEGSSKDIYSFKILSLSKSSKENIYILKILIFANKQEQKTLTKLSQQWQKASYITLAKQQKLFFPFLDSTDLVWQKKGLQLQENTKRFFKTLYLDYSFEHIAFPKNSMEAFKLYINQETNKSSSAYFSWGSSSDLLANETLLCDFPYQDNSSLKDHAFIYQSLDALSFETERFILMIKDMARLLDMKPIFQIRTKQTRHISQVWEALFKKHELVVEEKPSLKHNLNVILEDQWNRQLAFSHLQIEPHDARHFFMQFTLVRDYNSLIFFLMEHKKGKLPHFIHPESVRILCLTTQAQPMVKKIVNVLDVKKLSYSIKKGASQLGESVKQAGIENIPILIIIGEKEQKQGNISIRTQAFAQPTQVAFEQLEAFLEKELDPNPSFSENLLKTKKYAK